MYSYDTAPDIIKIGGIFSPFDKDGNVNSIQSENLAAFLMAIDEINDKTDGIFDWVLPNSQIVIVKGSGNGNLGAIGAVSSIMDSFFGTGIQGVVNGMPNTETISALNSLNSYEVVQASSMASDSILADGGTFPYKIQVCPVDSFQGESVMMIL